MVDEPPIDPPVDAPAETPADDGKVTRLPRARAPRLQVVSEPYDVREEKARMMLGPDAPYVPLGCDGEMYWIIDASRRVRGARPRDLSRNLLVSFCGEEWLEKRYPRARAVKRGTPQPVSGIAAEKASAELMRVCDILGYWSPDDHIRGLGAWAGADGDLILHRGNHLMVNGQVRALGRLAGSEHVYVPRTALPELPRRERSARSIDTAAEELRQRLDTFLWRRNTFDADLCLGWICAAMYSGALPWRTHMWVTGDFESGKSTLQNVISAVFAGGLVSVTDTTPAGLWQAIQHDSCPVLVDELEPGNDPRGDKQMRVVQLMRQASSGAMVLRGGVAGQSQQFTMCSPFLCTSIIVPPMPSQDASRIVILHLEKNADAGRLPMVAIGADLGARLTRRMADHFRRYRDDVMPAARLAMMEAGFTARLADGYAPIWAAADVAQHDEFEPARLARWLKSGPAQSMLNEAIMEQTPEHERCLGYLLGSRLDYRRPESATFGDLIEVAAGGLARAPAFATQTDLLTAETRDFDTLRPNEQSAIARLKSFGIKIGRVVHHETGGGDLINITVTIAASHRNLAEIFQNSIWRSLPEAANGGGWHQVLRRAPGAVISVNPVYFKGGVRSRATELPIELVLKMNRREIMALGPRAAELGDQPAAVH